MQVKRFVAILMLLAAALCAIPAFAFAEDDGGQELGSFAVGETASLQTADVLQTAASSSDFETLFGTNVDLQSYGYNWSRPVSSYLSKTDGGFMRVQAGAEKKWVVVAYYDEGYKLVSRRVISKELPLFGAFYETDDNFFIVSGQENPKESDSVEVFRVTKYDKDWTRLGSCGLYGANTTYPFEAGSCRCANDGKWLVVRTCHKMYTYSDGLNHQANVTMLVDTDAMVMADSVTGVAGTALGYVSHSFNQFVAIQNGKIVALDHGDAYPRSLCLIRYQANVEDGALFDEDSWNDYVVSLDVIEFPGAVGDNYTGAEVGAFEVAGDSYLVAGSYTGQKGDGDYETANVFVASVDRATEAVSITWLTNYKEGKPSASAPHMTKVSDNRYIVLWSRYPGDDEWVSDYDTRTVYYAFVDGSGALTSQVYTLQGRLSDCAPIVSDGKVIWYTWANPVDTFFEISIDNPGSAKSYRFINGSEDDIDDGRIDISELDVFLTKTKFAYTGSPIKPKVEVWDFWKLEKGTDYKVSYRNNVEIGTGYVTVTGKGQYKGKVVLKFKITKPVPTITARTTSKKVSAKQLKKKAQSFKMGVRSSSGGKLTYKVTKSNKAIKFKNGKATLKKGAYKKGKSYTIKVKVTSAAKGEYAAGSKTFTLRFVIG